MSLLSVDSVHAQQSASGPWRRRAADLLTALTILASVALVTVLGSVGSLFLDDVSLTTFGLSRRWPDAEFLTTTWFGHFMPAGLLIAWIEGRIFGQEKWLYGVTLGAAYLMLLLILQRVLWALKCTPWARAFCVVFFASSMSVTLASAWWANALWFVPLATITLLSILRIHSDGPSDTGWLLGYFVAGLLFTEKAVLLPIGMFAFAVAVQEHAPLRTAIGNAWRQRRPLWITYGALGGVALLAYLLLAGGPLRTVPFESRVNESPVVIASAFSEGLPGGVLGGPLDLVNPILAAPPEQFLTFSRIVLLIAVTSVTLLSRPGRRLLSWAVAYLTLTAVLLAASRYLGDGAGLVVLQVRYYADPVLWLTLALALAAMKPGPLWSRARNYLVPISVVAVTVSGILWTQSARAAVGVFRAEGDNEVNSYQEAMKRALATMPADSVVLDTPLRDGWFRVIESNAGEPPLLSDYYEQFAGDSVSFSSSAESPILYLPDERAFVRMDPVGHEATPSPPLCLTSGNPEGAIRLPAGLYPGLVIIQTEISSAGEAAVQVALDGRPGGILLSEGIRRSTTSWAEGGGDTVHFRLVSGTGACIERVTAGFPQVKEQVARF